MRTDPVNLEMLPSTAEALGGSEASKGVHVFQKSAECDDICLTPGCVYTGE